MAWKMWANALVVSLLLNGCATSRAIVEAKIIPAEPSASEPVTGALQVPAQVRAGERFDVQINLRIAGRHHIYATTGVREPFVPTKLEFHFPDGISPMGVYVLPTPERARNGDAIYTDNLIVRQSCRARPNVSTGTVSIQCEVRYQACTDELCWPPRTIQLASKINLKAGKGK